MQKRVHILAAGLCLCLLAAGLAVALLPAAYCGPLVDDFGYGAPVYYAIRGGLGLPGFFSALWENICYTYKNWQGTFASILLFSVQPAVFSSRLYWITPVVMLTLALAPIFLTLCAVRGMEGWGRLTIGGLAAALAVEYLPSPGQGIYWWNGGAHYIAFWFLAVLTFVLELRLSRRSSGGRGFWLRAALCWCLAFLVGGGNYSTALVFPLCAAGLTVYYGAYDRRGRRVVVFNGLTALAGTVGLVISMAAPGNAVRAELNFTAMPVTDAILGSFRCAAADLWRWLNWPVAAALVVGTAVFLLTTRESGYRYPLPGVVVAGGFCAYAALYTPALYAMGVEWAPPRMENLLWLAAQALTFGSVFYLAGWTARRCRLFDRPAAPRALSAVGIAGAFALALALALSFGGTNAAMVTADLRSGVMEEYRQARRSRQEVWLDKTAPAPRFSGVADIPAPESFMPTAMLTWSPDVLVDGVPAELPCSRICGGEVNFVPLSGAMAYFGVEEPWPEEDFPVAIPMGGETWVPIRAVADRLGYPVSYSLTDTIAIQTHPGEGDGYGAE